MVERIAVVGAGAVGGYVGACLADSGQDATLIDYWPAMSKPFAATAFRSARRTTPSHG